MLPSYDSEKVIAVLSLEDPALLYSSPLLFVRKPWYRDHNRRPIRWEHRGRAALMHKEDLTRVPEFEAFGTAYCAQ
jgi:hypothetical protein